MQIPQVPPNLQALHQMIYELTGNVITHKEALVIMERRAVDAEQQIAVLQLRITELSPDAAVEQAEQEKAEQEKTEHEQAEQER